MVLKRRDFLKSVGLAAVGLGLWDSGVFPQAQRYAQALAQPSRRKLALLVGIDRYGSAAGDCPALRGCGTDVDLQRQLLIYRFGFQPQDIVTLTNEGASRSAIETAFLEHLVQQAQPGDLVLFHFSGYGSEVNLPPLTGDVPRKYAARSSLVAADSRLPKAGEPVQDLPLNTLGLLTRALATDRVLVVLDTSHPPHPGITPLGVRWRSRSHSATGSWDPSILQFQASLQDLPLQATVPGLWFRGAAEATPAIEVDGEGISVGVFTASLTQVLWQSRSSSSLNHDWQRTLAQVRAGAGLSQRPQLKSSLALQSSLSPWGWTPTVPQGVEGVITAVNQNTGEIRLWLGGVVPSLLKLVGARSQFTVLGPEAEMDEPKDVPPLGVKVQWRDRWEAVAYLTQGYPEALPRLAVGQGIQEQIRWIPRQPLLTVGLEPQLDRIERIDATSAFDALSHVTVVNPENRAIDAWFARAARPTANPDPNGDEAKTAYGLWRPGQTLWPNTVGEGGEALKTAVQRLGPQLHSLLARKLWRATLNQGAGWPVRITLAALETPDRPLLQWSTLPNVGGAIGPNGSIAPATFTSGSRPQLTLENAGTVPLWALVLQLDSLGRATLVQDLGQDTEPGQTLLAPNSRQTLSWPAAPSRGLGSLLVWLSRDPLERVQASLPSRQTGEGDRLWPLAQPLALARQLLEDLQQISVNHAAPPSRSPSPDSYTLDCRQWMAWELPFRLI